MHRTERRAAMRYMEKRYDRGSPCVFISDIVASMKPCNLGNLTKSWNMEIVLLVGIGRADARSIRIGQKSNQESIRRPMMIMTCLIRVCSSSAIFISLYIALLRSSKLLFAQFQRYLGKCSYLGCDTGVLACTNTFHTSMSQEEKFVKGACLSLKYGKSLFVISIVMARDAERLDYV